MKKYEVKQRAMKIIKTLFKQKTFIFLDDVIIF